LINTDQTSFFFSPIAMHPEAATTIISLAEQTHPKGKNKRGGPTSMIPAQEKGKQTVNPSTQPILRRSQREKANPTVSRADPHPHEDKTKTQSNDHA
jgi:hypothetical protein